MKNCEFGSIRQIHQRLLAEGYALSEYALRQWVKTGRVPAVYSGKKAYITYASVLTVINGDATQQSA